MSEGEELRNQMDRLVGTWRSTGRFVGGDNAGDEWSGYDIYEWFPGRHHMVHRVDVEIFGGRKEAIEIFTPRAGSSTEFDQTSFDADGTVEKAVGRFDSEGRYRNDGEGVRALLTFHGPDEMRARWEMRQPDGSWIDWMLVIFARTGPPRIEVRSKGDHSS
ncbi:MULTISPECIES: hypothetical protein [unclassified Microbacterium]|uniref:hypothetical protein n=1 Tax=unclassified Microbacterium TaxID=2609290 RepID=UPI0011C3702A|nr:MULTISPECIES: hypothetical protein [unclassified Microbacterium]MBT2484268.1 hypothetical protein [Microbacterium sp. ISL-108]